MTSIDFIFKMTIHRITIKTPIIYLLIFTVCSNMLIQAQPSLKFPYASGTSHCITRTVQPIIGTSCGSFCQTSSSSHNGFAVDFGMPTGTNVLAAAGGTVIFAGFGYTGSGAGGFGNCVKIRHTDGTIAYYAHLNAIGVKVNDVVSQGCILGKSGQSGCSTGPHLHWEIRDASDNQKLPFSVADCSNQIPRSEYYAQSSNNQQTCTSNFNLNCSNAVSISNGVPYSGTTQYGNSNVSSYSCNSWTELGPEIVHQYYHSGGNLNATLTNIQSGVDLDVYILSSCNSSNCIGTVSSTSASYSNAPAGTYYIVVDGANTSNSLYNCGTGSHYGHFGTYTLTVNSSGGGSTCNTPSGMWEPAIIETAASLIWNSVPNSQSYSYRYRVNGTSNWTSGTTVDNFVSIYGLTCNTTYQWQVMAHCSNSSSNYSSIRTFSTSPCSGGSNPCNSIIPIGSCGSSYSQNFIGTSSGVWNGNACYHTYPGNEKIYSFVAPTTGTYSIQVTSTNDEYIAYLWKSGSCSQDGWTCINEIYAPGQYGSMSWTAGQTYYIRLDNEYYNQVNGNHTFYINCPSTPSNPCNDIIFINGCGSSYSQTFTGGGNGVWFISTYNDCGFYSPGSEQIYSFVAPTTGIYSIQVTSASGYVDYLWKSGSCNSNDWTCVWDLNSPGNYGNMYWTAGQTYYILLDDENTTSGTHTFYIDCQALSSVDYDFQEQITVYPNPTDGILHISSNYDLNITGLYVYDITGKFIEKAEGKNLTEINIRGLSSGVYLLKIVDYDNKTSIHKIIKE